MLKILIHLQNLNYDLASFLNEHHVDVLKNSESLIRTITESPYDIVILDQEVGFLKSIKKADPRIEVILFGDEKLDAVEAIKQGASVYFRFPLNVESLKDAVCSINKLFEMRRETADLERLLNSKYTFAGVVARNPAMLEIFNFIRRIAAYYRTVTIMGATGTGKEMIARAIHSLSPASKGPFVVCSCGGMIEGLIESELFGHKKGTFTGAIADKDGLFQAADGGTLFLDEIGELPLLFQPHFLRVLQSGEFRQVGSHKTLKATCRIIAATNKDLMTEVKDGRFREDLYYRLTPLAINLPPLSERKDDIPLLCRFLLDKFNQRTGKNVFGVSRPAQISLMLYNWPGNVRELENVIEQAAILTPESFIRVDDLPLYLREVRHDGEAKHKETSVTVLLEEIIKKHIESLLEQYDGNRTHAAKALGISRRALSRKILTYGI
jgi:two-component system, NtrC family, response regulator AtoC